MSFFVQTLLKKRIVCILQKTWNEVIKKKMNEQNKSMLNTLQQVPNFTHICEFKRKSAKVNNVENQC